MHDKSYIYIYIEEKFMHERYEVTLVHTSRCYNGIIYDLSIKIYLSMYVSMYVCMYVSIYHCYHSTSITTATTV